jgi:hypothetical protein
MVVGMHPRVRGVRRLRTVVLLIVAGCMVSFAAGQAVGHRAPSAPSLHALAADGSGAPGVAAIAGAISQAQRRATTRHATHDSATAPASQPHADGPDRAPHAMHDPAIHHRHGGQSGAAEQGPGTDVHSGAVETQAQAEGAGSAGGGSSSVGHAEPDGHDQSGQVLSLPVAA